MGDRLEMVNADEMVSAVLTRHPRAARVFLNHRMHCVGCAIGRFETLAEACAVYGVSVEHILDELREGSPEADRESEGNA